MSLSKFIGVIGGINDCVTLFEWIKSNISALRSQWSGTQEEKLQEEVLHLENGLQVLRVTLGTTYDLIDRAEWRIHEPRIAKLLPDIKDAAYDADDLLDEFKWHELKRKVEVNNANQPPFLDFFNSVVQGSFNKVDAIQKRLDSLSSDLEKMGLLEVARRFDKSIRTPTSSFPTEKMIFGRDKELEDVLALLGAPMNNSSTRGSKRKRATSGTRMLPRVPVLPIVGLGGVGKTTLVQHICNNQNVISHFDKIIWICVSDDFDVERLTMEAIQSLSPQDVTTDNLDCLQKNLVHKLNRKRFLLILDDVWGDALKENGQLWDKFCAPFTNVLQGSMLLMTTRSQEVANRVCTMDPFPLEGLKDNVFWDFFKKCVFGSEVTHMDPELEQIGRSIVPKLKGSPLAAKTIGRLLAMSINTARWSDILNNELWELKQEDTEILPALRLSYMYLPFHLKRCFSFCAVYPKDYNFEKASLTEIWVAEGFVEPEGSTPLQRTSDRYFEDLVNLSFFQKSRGKYVIHDLMHDMAQLVSKDECFTVKNANDVEKIPQNVRHLWIPSSSDLKHSSLSSLGKFTKLRTLLCNKSLCSNILSSAMGHWFNELLCLRVIFCASTQKLPESIGNLKHLRYFEISRTCNLKKLPSSFGSLYNLQIFYARKCNVEELPRGINKLIKLQKFESDSTYQMKVDAADRGEQIRFINKFYKDTRDLTVYNLGAISKDCAVELELWKIEYIYSLTLRWSPSTCSEHKEREVLEALQPPPTIKSVHLDGYPGTYLPSWFGGRDGPEDINGRVGTIFESLTELSIRGCQNLSSLEQFLQPTYAPAIRKIEITDCTSLKSVRAEWSSLESLFVWRCPNFTHLSAPSLKKLDLKNSGTLGDNINCSSLTIFHLSSDHLASIELLKWSLPVLKVLTISCGSLKFIGESGIFTMLTHLIIQNCNKLESLDDLRLTHECLPVIKSITITFCDLLLSLPAERFGSFSCLKNLEISHCPRLHWQSGTVLPPSLQTLILKNCGDFSAWSPSCLENLNSLESLVMHSCRSIVSIPGNLWSTNLRSLKKLKIEACPELVSIGGPEAITNINILYIGNCPKLKEIVQPRGEYWYVCHLVAV